MTGMKKKIMRFLGGALCLCLFAAPLSALTSSAQRAKGSGSSQGEVCPSIPESMPRGKRKRIFTRGENEEFRRWMGSLGIPVGVKPQENKKEDAPVSTMGTKSGAVSATDAADPVYTELLQSGASAVDIIDYGDDGDDETYEVIFHWPGSVLGTKSGHTLEEKWMWCARPRYAFHNGWRTGRDAVEFYMNEPGYRLTEVQARRLTDFICAYYYFFFNVYPARDLLSETQQYMLMQAILWTILNDTFQWYTGSDGTVDNIYIETLNNETARNGEWAAGFLHQIRLGVGKDWVEENIDKIKGRGEIFPGGSAEQPLCKWNGAIGKARLKKRSSNDAVTEDNGAYMLKNAVYHAYEHYDIDTGELSGLAGTFITDENGDSNIVWLGPGIYHVKEMIPPKGYRPDENVYDLIIPDYAPGEDPGTVTVNVSDSPVMNPLNMILRKADAETNKNVPQGGGSFKGARFEVRYYPDRRDPDGNDLTRPPLSRTPERTWVFETDEEGLIRYDEAYKVSGDGLYMDRSVTSGRPAVPLGTITIQEIRAPLGYRLNDTVYVRRVLRDEETVNAYIGPNIPDACIKLDMIKSLTDNDFGGECTEDSGSPSFAAPAPPAAEDKPGTRLEFTPETSGEWVKGNGSYRYRKDDGVYVRNGWANDEYKRRYYFDEKGDMVRGWRKIGAETYYFGIGMPLEHSSTAPDEGVLGGWRYIDGHWYYFNISDGTGVPKGAMLTGWQTISGYRYYFGPDGAMREGRQNIGGKTYYFDGNGHMLTGWQNIEGRRYYFMSGSDPEGQMVTGAHAIESGTAYYFSSDENKSPLGAMMTGWQQVGKDCYFFSSDTGNAYKNTWIKSADHQYYYAGGDGTLQTDGWTSPDGTYYEFDPESGALISVDGRPFRIQGVRFRHIRPDRTAEELATDIKGQITISGLGPGEHTIKETWTPAVYAPVPAEVRFTVNDDGTITFDNGAIFEDRGGIMTLALSETGDAVLDAEERLWRFRLQIRKISSAPDPDDPDRPIRLKGARLTLFEDEACERPVREGTSDDMGYIGFENLFPEKDYYLKEIAAPSGYRIPVDENADPIIRKITVARNEDTLKYVLFIDDVPVPDAVVLWDAHHAEAPRQVLYESEFAAANYDYINKAWVRMPGTGTYAEAALQVGGMLMMGSALLRRKKKKVQ